MKTLPMKSAENANLLGAWKSPALEVCTSRQKRRAYHKARREGRTGEQLDRKAEFKATPMSRRRTNKQRLAELNAQMEGK